MTNANKWTFQIFNKVWFVAHLKFAHSPPVGRDPYFGKLCLQCIMMNEFISSLLYACKILIKMVVVVDSIVHTKDK